MTHYTTHEIAQLLGFDPSTVAKWVDQGKLAAYRTPGGHRRVQLESLLAFLKEYEMPVPAVLRAARAEGRR